MHRRQTVWDLVWRLLGTSNKRPLQTHFGERDATYPNEVVPRNNFQPKSRHWRECTTHLYSKKTKPKARECSQRKVLPKSLIPSEQDQCHPSQSARLHHSQPLPRALWHGPVCMGTTNPLTILIYRPSVLQVVGFVVRCTGVTSVSLYGNFPQTSALAGNAGYHPS